MRKRKYVKVSVDMFENRKLKLIETNDSGLVYLEKDMPYTIGMLSIILNRDKEDIKTALQVLIDLKMIEMDENNYIKISSWSKYHEIKKSNNTKKQETNEDTKRKNKEINNIQVSKKENTNIYVPNKKKTITNKRTRRKKNDVILFQDEPVEKDIEIIEFHDVDVGSLGKTIETFTF